MCYRKRHIGSCGVRERCVMCVQHKRNPARRSFGRRLRECGGSRDSTAVRTLGLHVSNGVRGVRQPRDLFRVFPHCYYKKNPGTKQFRREEREYENKAIDCPLNELRPFSDDLVSLFDPFSVSMICDLKEILGLGEITLDSIL